MPIKSIIIKLVALHVLIVISQPASAFQVRRVETDSGTILRLRGVVRDGDHGRLKAILQNGSVVGLEIRSGGGSLDDGFEIARIVRDKGLVVYASKECDSVCALIFFAAKERYIGRGCKIGVHSVSNQHGKEDSETTRSTVMMSRLLARLGVPLSIIGKLVATPPAKITFLNNRELAELNVRRRNPFRNDDSATRTAPSQESSSACERSVNARIETPAHLAQSSCTTSAARILGTPESTQ
jgi:hypothetical protein